MLLTERGELRQDEWRHLDDREPVPEADAVTVSWARWQESDAALSARRSRLGLRLPNTAPVERLAAAVGRLDLVVLEFPKFTDGRAYSQARLLRGRLGFEGELRASGEVLRDQLLFMRRCGFNSFVVGERAVREDWAKAFGEFDVFYQPAQDERPWVMRQRLSPHINDL